MKEKNKKIIFRFCTLSGILLNVFLSSTNVYAKDRLHGKDRFDTAVEISKEGWKEGSDCIVIANGEKFPDSLSAAPLAKLKNAPLLLTKNDYLKDSVLQEVKRLKPKEIALVSGENFPDALSIASIAAQRKMPILLVEKNNIKLDTLNYIRNLKNLDNKYIIGGEGVISKENVEKKLDTSKRLCGENRFSTNLAVLEEFKNEILFNKIYVAKGSGSVGNEFADALSGAVLAAKNKETVILTGDSITKYIAEFIKKESSPKSEIVLLGGQSVVKDSIRCDIKIEAKELKELNNTNKTNIEIKNDSEINSIKSDESGKKTKIIARDNVKVGEVDKDLEIEGKLEKLNLKYDKSSGNEENQQENKKLKGSYEVELSQIKLNIENVKDSMISIKVCDSKGNIEYLNQIDKEKIQEGKTTLAFNVKKEGTYSIKILGNKSQNAKIENIKVSKLAKILEINDINISINENETFTLPKTVKAKMSNGKEKEVKIVWDNKEVDTSKNGEYVFEGNVEGYDKKVKLDLQVKELDKIKSLKNITIQLEQNDPYNMPNTITAIMNTGDKKEVSVKWNSVLDTSKVGEFVIEGTVEDFQGEVKLIAKIIAIDENEVVKFKNTVFEQIIRDTLYMDGDITRKDLNQIEELEVPSWMGYELNSIEDIYLLKNLKTLNLFGNFIEDIEPLRRLHNLEVLNLGACEAVENIEPLTNLTKLKELKLNGNIINNIGPLVNLTNLEKLSLGGNPIKDFSPTGKYFYNLKEKDFDFKLMKAKGNIIERDIEEGEKFFLPSVVTLQESKRNVAVKWDKNKVNTDVVGNYIFKGDIEGEQYNTIKLILNIKSIDNNKKIAFEDKELEKAIRLAISKPSGEIYRKDVVNLKKLPSLYSVKDLRGIENLQGLEELIIMTTSISDITPISKLKNLKRLELDTVGITSIKSGVFDDLNKLEFLNLAGNGIENISLNAFRGLKNLKEFNLADNKISKIKSGKLFGSLNNLEELTLDGNKIGMTDIEGNEINTIKNDAFRGLKNLKKLNIQGMGLDKVDFLENLSNLQWIDMRNNNIKDIKSLENLHKLDELWADHNKIEDLTPFKSLTQIEKLKLNSNEIKDIESLKDCVNLKSLCIQENSITTLKSLENMVKLEALEAKQNKIKDIEGLSNLVNLNSLYLENNQIEKVNPIANLTKLKILKLSGNKIKDYTPLRNIYNNLKNPDFTLKKN